MKDLLDGVHILWQNTSGAYAAGMHRFFPLEVVCCIDDGPDLDSLSEEAGAVFLSVEARRDRRSRRDPNIVIEEVLPALNTEVEKLLALYPRESWVLACPRPCRSFERF